MAKRPRDQRPRAKLPIAAASAHDAFARSRDEARPQAPRARDRAQYWRDAARRQFAAVGQQDQRRRWRRA